MVMVLQSRAATGVGVGGYHQALAFPAHPFLQMGGARHTEKQSDGGSWWLQTAGVFRMYGRETQASSPASLFGSSCSTDLGQCVDGQGRPWQGAY